MSQMQHVVRDLPQLGWKTEVNRQAYRTLLVTVPGLGQYISGAILFEETLYQSTIDGKNIVDILTEQNIVPGIKVDKVTRNKK